MTDATGMIDQSETARIYDRIAPLYDLIDGIYEHAWKRGLRQKLSPTRAAASSTSASVRAATSRSTPTVPRSSAST
jgi:hypothetical protein